jgi:hypothetical protein
LHDPVLVQQVDLALDHRDHVGLKRDQRDTGQPEPERLQKQEHHDDQHLTRLKHWLGNEISHQPAHRLRLRGDHTHQLALRRFLIIALWEAHHPRDQDVAKAPQQTLGGDALHGIEPHLEQTMCQDRAQIPKAQRRQKFDLGQLNAEHRDHRILRTDCIVDDPLGQFQRGVKERKGKKGHRQQDQLFALGILPDEGEQATVHGGLSEVSEGAI